MIGKYIACCPVLLCLPVFADGQHCNTIQLPDTLYTCGPNTTVQLQAAIASPYVDFRWYPTQGLSDTTILNPVATIGATPVTYRLIVRSLDTSVVLNGDFEQGNTGFTAPGYTLNCSGGSSSPGQYCILNNVSVKYPSYTQADHTSGTGLMMYVDPLSAVPGAVWRQTVSVKPNTDYVYEAWINNVHNPLPPAVPNPNDSNVIQLGVNGSGLAGTRTVAYTLPDTWLPARTVWNSGALTSVTLEVLNLNPTFGGNDYVLDDISLRAICADTASVYIGIASLPVVDLGPDTALCADSVVLRSSHSYTNPAYLWSTGATTATLAANQPGSYWLQVTEKGCSGSDTINVILNAALTVSLGNDTGICDRDAPLTLSSPQPAGTQYLWSTGLTTSSINVTRTDTYWLEATLGSCKGSDTIMVKVIPTPSVHIGNDSFICEGQPANIGDVIPGATYLWSTGSTASSIAVSESGSYWLTADLEGCKVSDTVMITVTPLPAPDLGTDGDICPEQVIVLDGRDAHYPVSSYRWNTGDTTSSLPVSTAGTYWVEVTSPYSCKGSDTVTFTYHPLPTVLLGDDTTVCEETPLVLHVFSVNSDSLRWSDGSNGDALTITEGGVYIVSGINKCGAARDTISVKQIFCDIWVPNAFTPNGDGVNDVFRVLGNVGRLESFRLRIFNRWGQLLFETSDRRKGWDGRQQSGEVPLGVYVYMLEYSLNGEPVLQKGNFTLLR